MTKGGGSKKRKGRRFYGGGANIRYSYRKLFGPGAVLNDPVGDMNGKYDLSIDNGEKKIIKEEDLPPTVKDFFDKNPTNFIKSIYVEDNQGTGTGTGTVPAPAQAEEKAQAAAQQPELLNLDRADLPNNSLDSTEEEPEAAAAEDAATKSLQYCAEIINKKNQEAFKTGLADKKFIELNVTFAKDKDDGLWKVKINNPEQLQGGGRSKRVLGKHKRKSRKKKRKSNKP